MISKHESAIWDIKNLITKVPVFKYYDVDMDEEVLQCDARYASLGAARL